MTPDGPEIPELDPGAAASVPSAPSAALELTLLPEDVPGLARLPALSPAAPSRACKLAWFDGGGNELEEQGLILLRDGQAWRLHRLGPGAGADWPACTPAPVLGEAPSPDRLAPSPPRDLAPVGAFEGQRRTYDAGPVRVELLQGVLRGIVGTRPACRLLLEGPQPALSETVAALAGLRVAVPRASLAADALAAARGGKAPARHLGAPAVAAGLPVSESLALIIAHLLDALLHWADRCHDETGLEPVHQARVATRRLRSALSLYKHAAPCPELTAAASGLKGCATRLGAVRDWDVFLDGTGAAMAAGAGNDPRVAALLRAARRRRDEVLAELRAYLVGPEFQQLELALGCAASLRPWEAGGDREALQRPTAAFAAEVLARHHKRVRRRGRDLSALPVPELHELRKDGKRLRYAAEFFAPCFPGRGAKPFLKRLAVLQEALGALNDASVAAELTTQLGRAGRGYAGGIVEGWAASAAAPARERIGKAWKRFRTAKRFWHD